MEALTLTYFPYPYKIENERKNGLAVSASEMCNRCDRQCERRFTTQLSLCSYGVNYTWFDKNLLVFGLVVSDYPEATAARKKVLRRSKGLTVTSREVEGVRGVYLKTLSNFNQDIENRKQ